MASHYQVQAIPAFNDNYIWMITQPGNRHCVLVDPGDGDSACRAIKAQDLILSGILVTHRHQDHIGGIDQIIRELPLAEDFTVYGPSREAQEVVTHAVNQGDTVTIPALDLNLTVLEIPGHTLGHIAYVDQHSLFCGDTLFAGGCGRVFEGTFEQMHHSLQTLAALPASTLVYCAHEYTLANLSFAQAVEPNSQALAKRIEHCQALRQQNKATVPSQIGTELATNPFLRTQEPEVIASASEQHAASLTTPAEVFAGLRRWKDNF